MKLNKKDKMIARTIDAPIYTLKYNVVLKILMEHWHSQISENRNDDAFICRINNCTGDFEIYYLSEEQDRLLDLPTEIHPQRKK